MANVDLLQARKTAILTELSTMVGGSGVANPNASGGGSFDFVGYRKSLYDELAQINQILVVEQGPFTVETVVET